MEFDTQAAAEALREAVAQDNASESAEQAPQTTETAAQDTGTEQTKEYDPGLFHGIDPKTLTPELKEIFDNMQASYTQKTQKLAEQQREYESIGDIDTAKNAVQFVQALQDPRNLVQLHSELSDYLQELGLSKQEADTVAAEELSSQKVSESDTSWQDEEDQSRVDEQLRRELDDLQRFKQQYEQERVQAEIEAALARQETAIRQGNPHYNDDNINDIYQMSYAYGGDLIAAQEAYETMRQRIASALVNSKESVPAAIDQPMPGAQAQSPETFGGDLNEAHRYAKQYVAGLMGTE